MKDKLLAYITTYVAARSVSALKKRYFNVYQKKLPIIAVAGNIGKSTLTMMTCELFRAAGYTVITGTTAVTNYNTPLGILYTLFGKHNMGKIIAFGLFGRVTLPREKSIYIQELGVDEQNGMHRYIKIFKQFDTVIMAGIADEHSGGFSEQIDSELLYSIRNMLPKVLLSKLNLISNPRSLVMALEQLQLIRYSNFCILPTAIGKLTSEVVAFDQGGYLSITDQQVTNKNGVSFFEKIIINPDYLVPDTFGVFFGVLQQLSQRWSLPDEVLTSTLSMLQLPNSRFGKLKGRNPFEIIIDSSYNSDPVSLNMFLEMLSENHHLSPHHIIVLGEMRELGQTALEEHIKILKKLKQLASKKSYFSVVLVGSEWKAAIAQTGCAYEWFLTVGEVVRKLKSSKILKGAWLWCKGSQNTIFLEELVKYYLINQSDQTKLCRQSEKWLATKRNYLIIEK